MKITLLVIGKTTEQYFVDAIAEYQKRLKFYIPFDLEVIPELKNTKGLTFEQQKEKEADLLLSKFQSGDSVVLLDERGQTYSSMEFASYIEKQMNHVSKRLVFVVGGPYGFSQRIYERANGKISLSKMTFSHQMVRLFFVEQIYRAMTILNNEPYHHE
ncbi:MAG: 23S rRNA (pseudouridine(1915)-N(3))-methyltransferase RlmH [Bacteroidales bacterium]